MLTYENYNEEKFAVRGDRNKHSSFIKTIGGRWNSRMRGGEGWLVPILKEDSLKAYINAIEKEPDVKHSKKSSPEHSKIDDIVNSIINVESEEDEDSDQDVVMDPIILKLLEENNLFSNRQMTTKQQSENEDPKEEIQESEPEDSDNSDDTCESEVNTDNELDKEEDTSNLKNLDEYDNDKEELEKERLEKEKLEKEELDRLEKERLEKEELENERLEKERLEKERLERERLERERLERERLEKQELDRLEKERLEREEIEKERKLLKEKTLERDNNRNDRIDRYLYDSDESVESIKSKSSKLEQDRSKMLAFKKDIMEKQRQKDIEKRKDNNISQERKKKINHKNDSLEYLTRFNKKPSKFKTMYVESGSSSEGEVYASSSEYSESSDDFPSPDSPRKFTGNKELLNQIKDLQRKVYALEIKNQKLRSENLRKR
tara:strand:+ start:2193 stop:3497 length:1305 start_codon:yes stop_codon:yes gene_type:complete